MFEEFDASLWDIDGLADYRPCELPAWLRTRLIEGDAERTDQPVTDCDLVKTQVADYGAPWLNAWGSALIKGVPVFICESDSLLDPLCLATDLGCGAVLVEPSNRDCNVGYTIYWTEGFRKFNDERNTRTEPSSHVTN